MVDIDWPERATSLDSFTYGSGARHNQRFKPYNVPKPSRRRCSMDSETIHRLLKAQPFQPFRLHLSNGRTHDVRHPELALIGKRDMVLGNPLPDSDLPIYENFEIISLLHVNDIQMPPGGLAGTNGPVAG